MSRASARDNGVPVRLDGRVQAAFRAPFAAKVFFIGPIWVALLLSGCTVPIAGGLDEGQANRVVVALERAGVGGEKEPDPAVEGRFRVTVEHDDAPHAIAALREEDLPSPPPAGLLESMGKGSLVPSQLAEHAQFVAGTSGELERTLSAIEGVLGARVHLSLPDPDPLREGPRPKATASVLLKHRGATPPIDVHEVKRLVAGAAPGLAVDDVAVVMVARPAGGLSAGDRSLSRMGPIAATRGSVKLLRIVAAGVIFVDLALVIAVLVLWSRLRTVRAAALEEAPNLRQAGRI
jgi:type III secretion protein J